MTLSEYVKIISVHKARYERMCSMYRGQYPSMEKKLRAIKKVERYIKAVARVSGTEDTQEKVIRVLYNYLDPFNSSDKEEKFKFLMTL